MTRSRTILRTCAALILAASVAGPATAQQGTLGTAGGVPLSCAPSPETLRIAGRLRAPGAERATGGQLGLRAPGGGGAGDSYHCCDADGTNCSGSVDALTICPVIKVRCREEDNACICD